MKKAELAMPEIMLIAGTRVMIGAGGDCPAPLLIISFANPSSAPGR